MKTHDSVKSKNVLTGMVAALALVVLLAASPVRAAGLLIADGGNGGVLEIKEHSVHVTINNGIAVTEVTQVFLNTENRQVEALYTFPVPKGASVANFSMWINGKEMVGEVLEKKKAREIYDSYKQKRRDPGLLEQTNFKTFEMRIFPIAAKAEQKVQITYYQELDFDHDWATYVYPLATTTEKRMNPAPANGRVGGKFSVTLDAKSEIPIAAMESPSHPKDFVIAKHSENYYQASLENTSGDLSRDVVISYHTTRPHTGLDLLTEKQGDEDGYFALTLTAGEELAAVNDGMDYVFLLDISGSMNDDHKLDLSRNSLGAFVNALGKDDRFEVMTFNVQPATLFKKLVEAGDDSKKQAGDFLATQQARGGTVLNPAITTAYKYVDAKRPLNVVILSDGLTEQGERAALDALIRSRPANVKVFCIGVGNDVNRGLLESLAQDAGGLSAFLSNEDNFERQAAAFRRKLIRPIATDLKFDFAGVNVYDVEPRTLPNLYHGMPVRIYGRYKGSGDGKIAVSGKIGAADLKKAVDFKFAKQDAANPEIERMWAWHKIDRLLKEGDAAGSRDTAIDEIIRLGEGYSIATEYTSFLVLENDGEFQRWQITRKNALRLAQDRKSQQAVRDQLEAMRNKASADLGPEPLINRPADLTPPAVRNDLSPQVQAPLNATRSPGPAAPTYSSPRGRDLDIRPGGGGGGAIDPIIGVIILAVGGIAASEYLKHGRGGAGGAKR
ncbi:MAG TPA: VIT and VWA domain-containing protein [Tepidisphaeraceae bacterium]